MQKIGTSSKKLAEILKFLLSSGQILAKILNVRISANFPYFEVWFLVNIFIYVLEQDSKKKKWGKLKLFQHEFFLGGATLFEGAGRGDPHIFFKKKLIKKFLN